MMHLFNTTVTTVKKRKAVHKCKQKRERFTADRMGKVKHHSECTNQTQRVTVAVRNTCFENS
jgi:hypothetical protein